MGAVIDAKLGISENANEFATVTLNTVSTNNGWTVAEGDLSSLEGKTVSIIALNFRSSSNLSSYEVLLGQLGGFIRKGIIRNWLVLKILRLRIIWLPIAEIYV